MKKTKYIFFGILCTLFVTSELYSQTDREQISAIRNESNTALKSYQNEKVLSFLTDNVSDCMKQYPNKRIGLLVFNSEFESKAICTQIVLSKRGDMEEAASKLYDALHQLDKENIDLIIAERFPDYGLGKSINDRLARATKN